MKITFPTIVYKCPGNHQCTGSTYDFIQVKSEEGLSEKLKQGYSLTLPEAMGEKVEKSIDEISPPTRDELKQKAIELGIEFPKNIRNDKLSKLIEEKLGE